MTESLDFIRDLYNKLKSLEEVLSKILKDEGILEKNILVKKGFLIKKYSINWNSINIAFLKNIQEELKKTFIIEHSIEEEINTAKRYMNILESNFNSYYNDKLDIKNIFHTYMNNAFKLSRLASVQLDELILMLEKGAKLRKVSGNRVEHIILSLEKMTNQIMKFIALLKNLDLKLVDFRTKHFHEQPRMYGRAMSKKEAKITISQHELIGSPKRDSGDLIAVFDCDSKTIRNLESMSDDSRRTFFKSIGVTGPVKIVFFETKLIPSVGPVPQSNGLREYKFPKGIHVDVLQAA